MAEHTMNSRLVALTDGVVTIAMTLLVLDIRLPPGSHEGGVTWAGLRAISEQLMGYVLSFVVVGLFWLQHAQNLRNLRRFTGTLFWLNMIFLLAVGLVPFTTSLLSASGNAVATTVYAAVMAIASSTLALMDMHVTGAGLGDPGTRKGAMGSGYFGHFGTTAVFVLSIVICIWSVSWAQRAWLLLIPLAFTRDRGGLTD